MEIEVRRCASHIPIELETKKWQPFKLMHSSSLWGDFNFDTDGFLTNYISIHTKIKTSWLGSFAGGFFQFFCHFFTLSCVKLGKWKTVATSKLSILKAETCISIRGSSKACICWPRRVSRSYKLRLTRSEYWYHEGCSKGWKKGFEKTLKI